MKRALVVLVMILALAVVSFPTLSSASAATGDRTVALTMKCGNALCHADWQWFQGTTILGSAFLSGNEGTTTGTTIQPAAADTLAIQLSVSICRLRRGVSFTPGQAINITEKIDTRTGCVESFNMRS
jgi:hypothetical protein